MEICIFRHGIAENGRIGHADSTRVLTDEGRRKVAGVAKLARRSGFSPSLILSSPYLRALQTAKVAAEELKYPAEILQTKSLVPESSPEAVWTELREHRDEASILLTGHEPLFSQLVAYLLAAPSLHVEMKKAAMVRIDVQTFGPAPHGILRWMITPAMVIE